MHMRALFTLQTSLILLSSFPVCGFADTAIEKAVLETAQAPGSVVFTPPQGWRLVDRNQLSASILAMVVGKGKHDFPPSINLGMHNESGTMKEFLKYVKETNQENGLEWKDLGTIRTQAGDASLSQFDTVTEWGPIREMQVIFVKDNSAYILTAAALKSEFPQFYKDFFASMKSLRINKTVYEMVPDQRRRTSLKTTVAGVKTAWEQEFLKLQESNPTLPSKDLSTKAFDNEQFQTNTWAPFKAKLAREFSDMSPEWHKHFMDFVKKEL